MDATVLETIELENFLSFTTGMVSFLKKDGEASKFSIITGPNGSGKSSIYQALKFVLGSNEKDGRYARWEDFINTGAGFMRVTATLRLAGGRVVEISRLMRRNKTSTFSLDGKTTSAVAITRFITSLRISPDNIFSFVSQGQINAIKELTPRSVFFLIESGIGIALLRATIENDDAKIQALHVDARDLDAQKETQLKHGRVLQGKMDTLRRKRDLESRLLETSAEKKWAQQINLENKIAELQETMQEHVSTRAGIDSSLASNSETTTMLEKAVTGIEEAIQQTKIEHGSLERHRGELKREISSWDSKKQAMLDEHLHLEASEEALTTRERDARELKEQIESNMSLLEITGVTCTHKKRELMKEQARIREELVKNQGWFDVLKALEGTASDAERELDSIHAKHEECARSLGDVMEGIEDINQEIAKSPMFTAESGTDTVERLDRKKASLAREIEQMQAKLHDARQLEATLRKQLGRSAGEAGRRKDQLRHVTELRQEIEARGLGGRVEGPIMDHLAFDPAHARAIEAIFKKHALLGFVAFNDDDFKMLNSLRNKLKVHCNIYMPRKDVDTRRRGAPNHGGIIDYMYNLVKVPQWLEPVFMDVVRETIVVESFAVGVSLIKTDDRAKCVTLDGVTIDSGKHALRSAPQYNEQGLLSGGDGSKGDDVEIRLNHASKHVETLEGSIERARDEIRTIERSGEETRRVQFFLKQKAAFGSRKEEILNRRDQLEEQALLIKKGIEDARDRITAHQHTRPKEFLDILNDGKRIDEQLEDVESHLHEVMEKTVALKGDAMQVDRDMASLASAREMLAGKRERLRAEIETNAADFKRVQADLDRVKASIEACTTRILESEQHRDDTREKIASLVSEARELEIKKRVVSMEIERLNAQVEALERERAYIETYLKDTTRPADLKSIEEYDLIINKLQARLSSSEFMFITDAIEDEWRENERIVGTIQGKIDEIVQEIDTLAASSDRLKRDYLARMEDHVRRLGVAINDKFSGLGVPFRVMLGTSGDFTTPGLAIQADFFDRVIPINGLSEGQKSIIALGLMLTLQDLNPSPICVFDEAHIFLDEANKDLISRLIKASTEHTQLVMLVPTTSHGFITTADKIIGIARQGRVKAGGEEATTTEVHLGPSRVIELA